MTRVWGLVMVACVAAACFSDRPPIVESKNQCKVQEDCISGYTCRSDGTCQPVGSGSSSSSSSSGGSSGSSSSGASSTSSSSSASSGASGSTSSTSSSSSSSGGGSCHVVEAYSEHGVDDDDNDGWPDTFDNCPFKANVDQTDSDNDSIGDGCDNCRSASNPTQADVDGDHLGDACDPDADGDGTMNTQDNCPLVPNPDQQRSNPNASLGDACNPDIDGDGVPNVVDNCVLVANPGQAAGDPALYGASCGATLDTDGDFVPDLLDNCPLVANSNQAQLLSTSRMGDACNPDVDGDGVPNGQDNCPLWPNPLQLDADRDGVGDGCDAEQCYQVLHNGLVTCLTPNAPYLATPGPDVTVQTGEAALLHIFVNQPNVPANFAWQVTAAPVASPNHMIRNPSGVVSHAFGWEYHYPVGQPAAFISTDPGDFTLTLDARPVNQDPFYLPPAESQRMHIHVMGPALGAVPADCGGNNWRAPRVVVLIDQSSPPNALTGGQLGGARRSALVDLVNVYHDTWMTFAVVGFDGAARTLTGDGFTRDAATLAQAATNAGLDCTSSDATRCLQRDYGAALDVAAQLIQADLTQDTYPGWRPQYAVVILGSGPQDPPLQNCADGCGVAQDDTRACLGEAHCNPGCSLARLQGVQAQIAQQDGVLIINTLQVLPAAVPEHCCPDASGLDGCSAQWMLSQLASPDGTAHRAWTLGDVSLRSFTYQASDQ